MSPSQHEIEKAKIYLLKKWKDRQIELGRDAPADLSGASKFASLFAKELWGGEVQGNEFHQYLVLGSHVILDLCEDSSSVNDLLLDGVDIYQNDALFIGSAEYVSSMASCNPRVQLWIADYSKHRAALTMHAH
jgi:hypothetical protein